MVAVHVYKHAALPPMGPRYTTVRCVPAPLTSFAILFRTLHINLYSSSYELKNFSPTEGLGTYYW